MKNKYTNCPYDKKWLFWMLEGPPRVLQWYARQGWFYPGNIQPKTFRHFYTCKEKVTLLTQCTRDLKTTQYLSRDTHSPAQSVIPETGVNLTFQNSDQIQNRNEGYVPPKGKKSSQWVWFTYNINAGLNTVKYTASILISQKREALWRCLSLLSGHHRSLTAYFPSMTLEDITGKISWQVFLNLL